MVEAALGGTVKAASTLAGGFSHETVLLTLADGQVVARFGGPDPAVEAAVMAAARPYAPVPEVLLVVPEGASDDAARPVMVLEHVQGTLLSEVLAEPSGSSELSGLGAEVGRVVAGIAAATFDRPGFFADEHLTVTVEQPWSKQLPQVADACMAAAPAQARLDGEARSSWADLCAAHAPSLDRVGHHSRLVHADINPKNLLVTRTRGGWRVDAVLDWEFSYAGCPYGDAANMLRFGAGYPASFVAGFRAGFAAHQPAGLPLAEDWAYLGRVLDMFALSDLVTRPAGHAVADEAAAQIRRWISDGIPDTGE
ncbi:phosphotransferase [Nonomuraea zeae]|uniref:phosphotransferase n=1 Tax=Nonomuraea zeae TaxID=1642303 RepID=UPI0014787C53|nr:phosphotransferase [Nonomuraea zeae]